MPSSVLSWQSQCWRWLWRVSFLRDPTGRQKSQLYNGRRSERCSLLALRPQSSSEHAASPSMMQKATLRMQLGEVAKAKPAVAIGSYPFFDPQHGPNTNVVLRARDAHKLAQAKRAVEEVLERVPWAQSS